MSSEDDSQISSIAALNEPVRHALYRYVVEQGEPVTRDQAADAVGITRALAAFHLDKLVEEGLLETSFRRLTGRTGPGAGRPSKLYRRSGRQVQVSLPPRSYELAAQLLATAVEEASSPKTLGRLADTARSFGEQLGAGAREATPSDVSQEGQVEAAEQVLAAYGFEPYRDEAGVIRLRNCPFHALADRHRQLICGMNLSLMQGLVHGTNMEGVEAILDPQPGTCCVAFRPIHVSDLNQAQPDP